MSLEKILKKIIIPAKAGFAVGLFAVSSFFSSCSSISTKQIEKLHETFVEIKEGTKKVNNVNSYLRTVIKSLQEKYDRLKEDYLKTSKEKKRLEEQLKPLQEKYDRLNKDYLKT
ncbi:hypothetical protein B6U93_03505, partial [Candidatus Woesearchaeota archaeon ex4484_78]